MAGANYAGEGFNEVAYLTAGPDVTMLARIRFAFIWFVQSFIARISEWGLSFIVLFTGLGLLAPGDTYDYSSGLRRMLDVMPEAWWGATMVAIGTVSLWALWTNGVQAVVTSRARVYCAISRSTVWLALTWAFLDIWFLTGQFHNAIAIYPICVLMDWAIIVRASWEHRDAAAH